MRKSLAFALGMVVAATGPSLAGAISLLRGDGGFSPRFIENASCDSKGDDKQARCMESCDETWIKATQAYNTDIEKARADKKTCEAKCGC